MPDAPALAPQPATWFRRLFKNLQLHYLVLISKLTEKMLWQAGCDMPLGGPVNRGDSRLLMVIIRLAVGQAHVAPPREAFHLRLNFFLQPFDQKQSFNNPQCMLGGLVNPFQKVKLSASLF